MTYTLLGRLCGYICGDCWEPLSDLVVRVYRPRLAEQVPALAAASPKETLAIIKGDEQDRNASSLLAEVRTDGEGRFALELDEDDYAGDALDIEVYCETVPRATRRPDDRQPLQLSITTLQPEWRRREEGLVAVFDYCLPYRFWCAVRAYFGAWTICGNVTLCDTKQPLAGLTVHAFDADWIQDDELGVAVTAGDGSFRIDYFSPAFEKTPLSPFLNFELVGGPDVYFKIEAGSTVVLDEDRSRARQPDRENVGPCFCVALCVDEGGPGLTYPWFTHIGDFHVYSDLDPATGLTNAAVFGHGGPGYAFTGAMKLYGFCPKTAPLGAADPMRYRFLYEHPANPGVAVPITGAALVFAVNVGFRQIPWDYGSGPVTTFQTIRVAPSGASAPGLPPIPSPPTGSGPPPHVIVPDAAGWVEVDQLAHDDGFYGPLIGFNSNGAVPGGPAPGSGPANPVGDPRNGAAVKLIFEAQRVSGSLPTLGNAVEKVHVSNWQEVRELNLQQFTGPGATSCSPITSNLDVLYTVDHELLAEWSLSITSASPSDPGTVIPPLPASATSRGAAGTHHENTSGWQSCSYTVTLTTRRKLTDGHNDDDATHSSLTFCT